MHIWLIRGLGMSPQRVHADRHGRTFNVAESAALLRSCHLYDIADALTGGGYIARDAIIDALYYLDREYGRLFADSQALQLLLVALLGQGLYITRVEHLTVGQRQRLRFASTLSRQTQEAVAA